MAEAPTCPRTVTTLVLQRVRGFFFVIHFGHSSNNALFRNQDTKQASECRHGIPSSKALMNRKDPFPGRFEIK
jgi:hypothetical protein